MLEVLGIWLAASAFFGALWARIGWVAHARRQRFNRENQDG